MTTRKARANPDPLRGMTNKRGRGRRLRRVTTREAKADACGDDNEKGKSKPRSPAGDDKQERQRQTPAGVTTRKARANADSSGMTTREAKANPLPGMTTREAKAKRRSPSGMTNKRGKSRFTARLKPRPFKARSWFKRGAGYGCG